MLLEISNRIRANRADNALRLFGVIDGSLHQEGPDAASALVSKRLIDYKLGRCLLKHDFTYELAIFHSEDLVIADGGMYHKWYHFEGLMKTYRRLINNHLSGGAGGSNDIRAGREFDGEGVAGIGRSSFDCKGT